MQSTTPDLYLNMQQFSELKLSARQHSKEASKAVAQQFEGLFVQMMLKNMRAAAVVDPAQHSSNMDFYMDMYDKQMSLMLSQQGGIGIADLLERQLQRYMPQGQESADAEGKALPLYRLPTAAVSQLPLPQMDYVATNPALKTYQLDAGTEAIDKVNSASPSLRSESLQPFYGWEDADSLIYGRMPSARPGSWGFHPRCWSRSRRSRPVGGSMR